MKRFKNTKALFYLVLIIVLSTIFCWMEYEERKDGSNKSMFSKEFNIDTEYKPLVEVKAAPETVNCEVKTLSSNELSEEDFEKEYEAVNAISDNMEKFIKYKELIKKYEMVNDPPETIYDYYSSEDIEILHRIVEAECGNLEFYKKVNVAHVIFNRINSDKFPDTVSEVVFQKNPVQFSPIVNGAYDAAIPSDETLLAIEYAFMFPDTTGGALFFEANYSSEMRNNMVLCDGSHKFYK